jgi:hypothetical protein
VFALANGLAEEHMLSDHDHAWLRESNARANAAYTDPSTIDPTCYDPDRNPGARAWFEHERHALLALSRQYLELLDRYGVGWTELRTTSPGRIVYEDPAQIVAVPASYAAHWPFSPKQ